MYVYSFADIAVGGEYRGTHHRVFQTHASLGQRFAAPQAGLSDHNRQRDLIRTGIDTVKCPDTPHHLYGDHASGEAPSLSHLHADQVNTPLYPAQCLGE